MEKENIGLEALNSMSPRDLFILASDVWETSIFIELWEPYKTIVLNAELPNGVHIDDEKEILDAALGDEASSEPLIQTVLDYIESKKEIPEKLQRFLYIKEIFS
jgi:hypothetical protein